MQWKERVWGWMSIKRKVCSYYSGRKLVFRKWILVASVVSVLVQCTKCQRWVHRRYSDVRRQVSLLSCLDVFVCRTCLGHNCLVQELEFKRGDDVLEEVEEFCYLDDMISCYGGASETVSASVGSAWKKFRELSGVLVGKQGLSFKQWAEIYQCCGRPILLHCCETRELTVADEARLRGSGASFDQGDV